MFPKVTFRHSIAPVMIFLGSGNPVWCQEMNCLPFLSLQHIFSSLKHLQLLVLVLKWYFNPERSILPTFLSFSHPWCNKLFRYLANFHLRNTRCLYFLAETNCLRPVLHKNVFYELNYMNHTNENYAPGTF